MSRNIMINSTILDFGFYIKSWMLLMLLGLMFVPEQLFAEFPMEETKPLEDAIETGEGEDHDLDHSTDPNRKDISTDTFIQVEHDIEFKKAKIITLNKITAKSEEMILKSNAPQYFGNIELILYRCLKHQDQYSPDNKALIKITEHKLHEDPVKVFQGWLFSSSITASTFEHPVYEVFVKECI